MSAPLKEKPKEPACMFVPSHVKCYVLLSICHCMHRTAAAQALAPTKECARQMISAVQHLSFVELQKCLASIFRALFCLVLRWRPCWPPLLLRPLLLGLTRERTVPALVLPGGGGSVWDQQGMVSLLPGGRVAAASGGARRKRPRDSEN